MTTRTRHDRHNTGYIYRRLPAGYAGARQNVANQGRSRLRHPRANRAWGSASAAVPRLVIDQRRSSPTLARSATLLAGVKSP